jgi:hypothetical protein
LYQDAATDVHPYNIGDNLVAQITRKADDTSGSGMYVGHDADFAIAEHWDSQQPLYLLNGSSLDIVREYLHVVILNGSHCSFILVISKHKDNG